MKKLIICATAAILASGTTAAFATEKSDADATRTKRMEEVGKRKEAFQEKYFKKNDTDGDGFISKEEMMKHAEENFAKKDTDNDGKISKDEAKAYHEAMREKVKERIEEEKKEGVKVIKVPTEGEAPAVEPATTEAPSAE